MENIKHIEEMPSVKNGKPSTKHSGNHVLNLLVFKNCYILLRSRFTVNQNPKNIFDNINIYSVSYPNDFYKGLECAKSV